MIGMAGLSPLIPGVSKKCIHSLRAQRLTMVSSHSKTYEVEKLHSNISTNLNEDDPDRRIAFCEWYITQCEEDEQFPYRVCWSDETTFQGLLE
jgi:hypothetical protein